MPVRSPDFRSFLCRLYFEKICRALGGQALQGALGVFDAKAKYEGREEQVYCHVARVDGAVYLDLANTEREIVAITRNGWQVISVAPVRFSVSEGNAGAASPSSRFKIGFRVEAVHQRRRISVRPDHRLAVINASAVRRLSNSPDQG
jgi:hypothetical protein